MAAATPLAASAGCRSGRRPVLLAAGSAALLSGFLLAPMLGSGSPWQITAFLSIELFLMGATFAPMGALLPELFPTAVRYSGAGGNPAKTNNPRSEQGLNNVVPHCGRFFINWIPACAGMTVL